jgi:ABC-2 type transport system ATP-binding protein
MQQRLCLARCLVHDPALLLLDEPASGLDPRARAELKELIAELGRMGKIVIVSSHFLPELADFCNTVGIIEKGQLLACGPVASIVQGMHPNRVLEAKLLDRLADAAHVLADMPHVLSAQTTEDGVVRIDFTGSQDDQADLLAELVKREFRVVGFREEQADLEDVFLRLTTGAVQ